MKTINIKLLILSLLFVSTTYAAEGDAPPPAEAQPGHETHHDGNAAGIGIHGGFNFANYNYSHTGVNGALNNRVGWLAGLHLEGWAAGVFAIRPEINYSVKGYEVTSYYRVDHSYLQIPLLFKLTPFDGPFKIYVEGGPAASLHLGTTVTALGTATTYNDNSDNWDFSLIGGVGVGVKINNVMLHVEGRYDYGLKNLSNTPSVEVKSRAIQAIAGLTFLND